MTESVHIGVIGGSGLYKMPELTDVITQPMTTLYGSPSADVVIGTLRGKRVAFLPRHGVGHVYSPSNLPYRANILALKMLGVRKIIAVNACGSLREDYAPGHIVIPDQLFDHTKADRGRTFFETDIVAHTSIADPFCANLSNIVAESVRAVGGTVHEGGTFITIEGPRFSTKGESNIFRQWGCSIIGMTTSPEAFLAREAEMCYMSMSHVTDYDVWHESQEPVTVEMVVQIMNRNLEIAQQAVADAVENIDGTSECPCHNALEYAFITDRTKIPRETIDRMRPLIGRYFPEA
ncbi:MAG: S-methyl-5'-thioadenosine phosphorylase [Chloroflexi bacterium]|nr:S-methyl-5'-thioadenosine phosphorylase [Chloroflexota bacterium]